MVPRRAQKVSSPRGRLVNSTRPVASSTHIFHYPESGLCAPLVVLLHWSSCRDSAGRPAARHCNLALISRSGQLKSVTMRRSVRDADGGAAENGAAGECRFRRSDFRKAACHIERLAQPGRTALYHGLHAPCVGGLLQLESYGSMYASCLGAGRLRLRCTRCRAALGGGRGTGGRLPASPAARPCGNMIAAFFPNRQPLRFPPAWPRRLLSRPIAFFRGLPTCSAMLTCAHLPRRLISQVPVAPLRSSSWTRCSWWSTAS